MKWQLRVRASAAILSIALAVSGAALAQKVGGTLKIGHFDSPASMSMLEESRTEAN